MKKLWLALPLLLASAALPGRASAQAPAGAPAGSTGQCNDGTYWTNATKSGACRGHKGVKTWYADAKTASPAAAATPAKPAAAPQPAAPAAKPGAAAAKAQAAPGGGNGQVWVNSSTNVYHCPGDRYYGKTKEGKYMSEADAKKSGAKPDHGNSCSK